MISVIMPVYNSERYLSETIESICNQSFTDWELVIVDDGSKDNSVQIIEAYAEKDRRIKLYKNESVEHGPGSARNIGLDNAKGEFIYFIDADDWIDKSLLQCAVDRMQETNADIVQFGAVYEHNDSNESQRYCWKGKELLTKSEIKNEFLNLRNENLFSLWLQFFRKEAVKEIRFENIITGEDISFVVDAFAVAEKIAFIPNILYHYRYVKGSTSHRWNEDTIMCRETIWRHQKNCLDSFGEAIDKSVYSDMAYDNYLWAIYQLSSMLCPLSYREKKSELIKLKEKMCFDEYRCTYPSKLQHGIQKLKYLFIKYRLEEILLLIGPVFLKIVRRE